MASAKKKTVKKETTKKKIEFSKFIVVIETLLTLYVTYETVQFIKLSIASSYLGTLPYLTTLIGVVWAAYGTSVGFYYKKAERENVIKISSAQSTRKSTTKTTTTKSTKKIDC